MTDMQLDLDMTYVSPNASVAFTASLSFRFPMPAHHRIVTDCDFANPLGQR